MQSSTRFASISAHHHRHVVPTCQPCPVLLEVLENVGFRELAMAELYAASVRLAPTLDDKQVAVRHAAEELHHFEQAASAYEYATGAQLLPIAEQRVARLPGPTSWVEAVIVVLLLDRACTFQLRAYERSPDRLLRALARRLLSGEPDHLGASAAALVELCTERPELRVEAQRHLEHWLPRSLDGFDDRETRLDRCASAPHVDPVDTLEAVRRYLASLGPALHASGLTLPHRHAALSQASTGAAWT